MAGFAARTPIGAAATHLIPVAENPDATQAEPILLGSQSVAEVIAVAMGQITDEDKKIPITAVQGLSDVAAALEAILAGGD